MWGGGTAVVVVCALYPPFADSIYSNLIEANQYLHLLAVCFVSWLILEIVHRCCRNATKKDRYDVYFEEAMRKSNRGRKNRINRNRARSSKDSLNWGALFGVIAIGLGSALAFGLLAFPNFQLEKSSQSRNSKSSSGTPSRPVANPEPEPKPKAPKPKYDPALAVRDHVYFRADSRFPHLTTDDYKKAAGDLARIQYKMFKNRGEAKNYPYILIGNGIWRYEACNEILPKFGLYQFGGACDRRITINFEANGMHYEHQIEVLVTLAHEWGHHLIHLSGENISGIANELLADCFAGVYIAYLDKHGAISEQELRNTVKMMGVLGNTHGTGIHGTPAQRVNGLLSGALFIDDPNDPKNQANWDNYCKGLEDIIDVREPLP